MRPKVIHVGDMNNNNMQILKGPPENECMRSGLVVLSPKDSVGRHNTDDFEELIIILDGEGTVLITGQDAIEVQPGDVVYCPPNTEHDVINASTHPLGYIYVVAKVGDKECLCST